MTLVGCWRFTGGPTHNGMVTTVVTVGNNEILMPDSLLCELTKASKSLISETNVGLIV